MSAALGEGPLGSVISDHSMPGFGNSWTALELIKDSVNLDIPFIVCPAPSAKTRRCELMKAGASDFVMKEKHGRLAPSSRNGSCGGRERRSRGGGGGA